MMRHVLRGRSDTAVMSFHKQTSFSYDDMDMIDDVFHGDSSFDQVEFKIILQLDTLMHGSVFTCHRCIIILYNFCMARFFRVLECIEMQTSCTYVTFSVLFL